MGAVRARVKRLTTGFEKEREHEWHGEMPFSYVHYPHELLYQSWFDLLRPHLVDLLKELEREKKHKKQRPRPKPKPQPITPPEECGRVRCHAGGYVHITPVPISPTPVPPTPHPWQPPFMPPPPHYHKPRPKPKPLWRLY